MIPIRDLNPSRTYPFVTVAIIALNALAFAFQLSLGPGLETFIKMFGAVPFKIAHNVNLSPETPFPVYLTLVTSMFLHGGVMHLAGNMWFLWIFGDNVEDRLGHFKFLVFYLFTGIVASISHMASNADSLMPMVGASGAIAGVLGAYLVLFPRAQVLTVIPIFVFLQFVKLPAVIFLGLWFVMQILYSGMGGGVAWYAHIGGFAIGALLVLIFAKRPRWRNGNFRRDWN